MNMPNMHTSCGAPGRLGRARPALAWSLALSLASAAAQQATPAPPAAQAEPISEQEFQSSIVDKSVSLTNPRGINVQLRLEKDGRSVASGGFNDVGRWRVTGPGSYCARWNKLPSEERCSAFARRGSQLVLQQADGQVLIVNGVE